MEKKRNHTWWKTTWNSLKLYCSPKHWPWTAATGHQGELRLFEISSSDWKWKLWKAFSMAGRLGDIQKIQSKKVLRGCSVTFRGETVSINFIWRRQRQTKWISLKPSVVDLGVYWGYSQEHGVLAATSLRRPLPADACCSCTSGWSLVSLFPQSCVNIKRSVSCSTPASDPSCSDLRWQ